MDIFIRIIDKFFSARFWLAIMGGIAFVWCVIHKQLEAATIAVIIVGIFDSYFNRKDRKPPSGGA